MEIRVPNICRVQQVEIGSLFVMLDPRKGNAICLKAAYNMPPEDADEAIRVVPLYWPNDPDSVGVAIYATVLAANAVVIRGARLEVDPLSASSTNERSVAAVYARDDRLFIPLRDKDRFAGLVDAQTGQILDTSNGSFVPFDRWFITVDDDWSNREVIFPVEEPA